MTDYESRIIRRIKFFKQYPTLCRKAFKNLNPQYVRKEAKSKHGAKLVLKAREVLQYSKGTSDGDIFCILRNAYYELKTVKII